MSIAFTARVARSSRPSSCERTQTGSIDEAQRPHLRAILGERRVVGHEDRVRGETRTPTPLPCPCESDALGACPGASDRLGAPTQVVLSGCIAQARSPGCQSMEGSYTQARKPRTSRERLCATGTSVLEHIASPTLPRLLFHVEHSCGACRATCLPPVMIGARAGCFVPRGTLALSTWVYQWCSRDKRRGPFPH